MRTPHGSRLAAIPRVQKECSRFRLTTGVYLGNSRAPLIEGKATSKW